MSKKFKSRPAVVLAGALTVLLILPSRAHPQSARFNQFPQAPPMAGELAPNFTLMTLENESFNLLEVAAEQPVVIEFGSFT